jgi:NAD-dependent SIR2 family protein deacetylase
MSDKELKMSFTYEKLIDGLKGGKFERIVVMTGAGISTSAGIPDFRSPGTGLYSQMKEYNLPTPESVFDLTYFKENPEAFARLAKEFLDQDKFNPTPTHFFCKMLENKGLLKKYLT